MDILALGLVFLTILFIISFRHTPLVYKFDSPKNIFKRFKDLPMDQNGFITKEWMAIIVTLTILGCSLYIILSSNYDSGTKNWAFGSVGAITGFWLRNER